MGSLLSSDPATKIEIVPLEASNSLLIVAPTDEHEKIAALLSEIDVEPVKGFGDLQLAYFPLVNSDVTKLADVLNELLTTAQGGEEITAGSGC